MIADSTVAVCLKPAFENILGEAEREKYPNLVAWYGTVSSDGKLKKHLKTSMAKERKQYDAKEVAGKLAKEEEKARKKAEKEAKFAAKKAAQARFQILMVKPTLFITYRTHVNS